MYTYGSICVNLKWRFFSTKSLHIYRKDAPDVFIQYRARTRIKTFPRCSPHSAPAMNQILSVHGALIYALPMSHAITSSSFSAAIKNASHMLSIDTISKYGRATGASVLLALAMNLDFQVKSIFMSIMT